MFSMTFFASVAGDLSNPAGFAAYPCHHHLLFRVPRPLARLLRVLKIGDYRFELEVSIL